MICGPKGAIALSGHRPVTLVQPLHSLKPGHRCHRAGVSPNVIAEMTQRPRVISQVVCGIGIGTLVGTLKHLCIGGTTYHRLVRPPLKLILPGLPEKRFLGTLKILRVDLP